MALEPASNMPGSPDQVVASCTSAFERETRLQGFDGFWDVLKPGFGLTRWGYEGVVGSKSRFEGVNSLAIPVLSRDR